jgi:hypothetical protein
MIGNGAPMKRILVAMLGLAACAQQTDAPPAGFGSLTVALGANLQDVKTLQLQLYDQPGATGTIEYDTGCVPVGTQAVLTLSPLTVGGGRSILARLFADDGCKTQKYGAFRGDITVAAVSETESQAHPYFIQPYELGKFTSMAPVSSAKQQEMQARACVQDADCRSYHPAGTCRQNKCAIDSLFPLDGGSRRAYPNVRQTGSGEVLISGGLQASIDGAWSATNDQLELFDPATGLFRALSFKVNGPPAMGLVDSVQLAGDVLLQAGGAARVVTQFAPGQPLKAVLDTKGCAGGTGCKVSSVVSRLDIAAGSSKIAQLGAPLAFPSLARVQVAGGERVLVAGGLKLGTSGGDQRTGQTLLCKQDSATLDCSATGPTMKQKRARAATACLKTTDGKPGSPCVQFLLLGGRKGNVEPLAEVWDASKGDSGDFVVPAVTGQPPAVLHGGELVPTGVGQFLLLGATTPALFVPGEEEQLTAGGQLDPYLVQVNLTANPPSLSFTPLPLGNDGKRVLASAAVLNDKDGKPTMVLYIGGIDGALQPRADALLLGPNGAVLGKAALGAPRFGAGAAVMGGNSPLARACVMLAGGFTLTSGGLEALSHTEVFCAL